MTRTRNGTPYTSVTFEAAGELSIFAVANSVAANSAIPTLLYAHGNTGLHDQFTHGPMWQKLRDALIDEGWAYVESAGGGPSSWGNQQSRDAYEAAISQVDGMLDIGAIAVLGRSMGGLVGAWIATQSTLVAHRCVGIIFNSAVTDLKSKLWHDLIAEAHGAEDEGEFAALTAPYDPMQFPLSVWEGRNAQWLVGTADALVPPAVNGVALRDHVAEKLNLAEIVVVEGANHSAAAGTYNEVDTMMGFLRRVAA